MEIRNDKELGILKEYVREVIIKFQNNAFWKAFTQSYTLHELLELVDDIQRTDYGIYFDSAKLKSEIDIRFLIYQVIGYALCLMEQQNLVKKSTV